MIEIKSDDGILSTESIVAKINEIGDELALVLFPGVQYYTGQGLIFNTRDKPFSKRLKPNTVFDMSSIITTSHNVGAVCGLDLAHAVGNVQLHLHRWAPDFAVWCNYKVTIPQNLIHLTSAST